MGDKGANALQAHTHFQGGEVVLVGIGASGAVYKAQHVSYGEVAVKLIPTSRVRDNLKHFVNEVINHRRLSGHAHIINFRYLFAMEGYVGIVMEYANHGNLVQYIKQAVTCVRDREGLVRWYFQQLITALDYCHRNGVVNRDLKLDNTLLSKAPSGKYPLLKICDFGHSKWADMSPADTLYQIGTYAYLAPEFLNSLLEPESASRCPYDGKAVDVWSCGVMLYALMFSKLPFGNIAGSTQDLLPQLRAALQAMNLANYKLPDPHIQPVSDSYKDLLQRVLQPNPQSRIRVSDIMQHPWFTTNLKSDILTYNDRVIANSDKHLRKAQTEADIIRILQQAVGGDALMVALQESLHQSSLLGYLT